MSRQYISPKKTVEYLRSEDPYDTSYLTDREVYKYAQQKYTDIDWPVWHEDEKLIEKEPVDLSEPDPNIIEKLFTTGIAELGADDGAFWADTYNKSSAGMLYQALHGKTKYQVDDYNPEWWKEIGQFFIGHVAPLDALLFFGSGAIGGATANYVGKKFLSKYDR